MHLLIDTTEKGILIFKLQDEQDQVLRKIRRIIPKPSEELLLVLKKFLKENDLVLEDLTKILVNPGPGAFSSTRTGVATANALAYALNIPIAEYPSGKIWDTVSPKYDREPHITKPEQH